MGWRAQSQGFVCCWYTVTIIKVEQLARANAKTDNWVGGRYLVEGLMWT